MNQRSIKNVLSVGCLLFFLGASLRSAAGASGPFADSCLTGRYVTTGSGLDITFLNPFAVVGFLNFTCTKNGTGTYAGSTIVTYPVTNAMTIPVTTVAGSLIGMNSFNNVVFPTICSVSGSYTIDPTTGLIASNAMLADPDPGSVPTGLHSCTTLFSDLFLQEFGYLSDPTAQKLSVVETGQDQNDVLSLVYTKAGTQNSQ